MPENSSVANITITAGPEAGNTIGLSADEIVIGRMEPAGLVLNHREVSRLHARICYRNGQYVIEDLGSRNGTQVNGKPLQGSLGLNNGDEILLGTEVRLSFALLPASAPVSITATQSEPAALGTNTNATMLDMGANLADLLPSKSPS